MRSLRSIWTWLALLAACGGDSNPAFDATAYAQSLLDARCTWLAHCGVFATKDDCTKYFWYELAPRPQNQQLTDTGRTRYDPKQAQACFDAIAGQSCDISVRNDLSACDHVFVGTGAVGDACGANVECASNNCLLPSSCPTGCCQATCGMPISIAKIGESCAQATCEPDAFCNQATLVCQARVGGGGACTMMGQDSNCASGFACVGNVCRVLAKLGESCTNTPCGNIGASCLPSMVCALPGVTGAPCAGLTDCSMYYTCSSGIMQCVPLPTVGMPCLTQCTDHAWCDRPSGASSGTCRAPQPDGASCMIPFACQSDDCDGTSHTCVEPPICL